MAARPPLIAALLLCAITACTRSPTARPFLAGEQADRGEPCQRAATVYLAARDALNFCATDADCVEIEPGPCLPAYHANIATADRSLRAAETTLAQRCGVATTDCARPSAGAPRCEESRCVPGRRPQRHRRPMSCWLERWRVLEFDHPNVLHLRGGHPGPLPREARIVVPQPGELTLDVDSHGCPLEIDLHPSDGRLARLTREATPTGQRLRMTDTPTEIDVRVQPTPWACELATITPHLTRPDGTTVPAKHHGVTYQGACEY